MVHNRVIRSRLMAVGAVASIVLSACSAGSPTASAPTVTTRVTVGASPQVGSTSAHPAVTPRVGSTGASGSASPSASGSSSAETTPSLGASASSSSGPSNSVSSNPGSSASSATKPATPTIAPAGIVTEPRDGATNVSPIVPVVVRAENGKLTEVAMTNPEGREVAGKLSPDQTKWTSTEVLGYGRGYKITATANGSDEQRIDSAFTTLKPRQTIFPSFFPSPQMKTIGVGQPMVVIFDKPPVDRAAAEKTLTVTTVPAVKGAWYWWDNRTLHYRPQSYWKPGTKITVSANVYGVNLGGNAYGETDRTLKVTVGPSKIAKIDDATKKMQVYIDGKLVRTVPVSMGMDKSTVVKGKKISFVTPSGTYVAQEKYPVKQMSSATYGLPTSYDLGYDKAIPLAVRISGEGIFVHSAPWSVADQGVRNVSHGCINISPDAAKWFYKTFSFGDIVQVTGTSTKLAPTDGFGDWNIPWEQWQTGSALS